MDTSTENDQLLREMNNKKIEEYAPAIAYSALVILTGIVGNIFSIAYYGCKSKSSKTTTNILITALATTDLIACVVFSDEIIELCFTIAFKNVIGCKIMYFTNHTIVFSSACILFLICLDRFQKICRRQSWQFTETTARIGICVVIAFCVAISVRDFIILDVVQVNLTDLGGNSSVIGYYCTHSRESGMKPIVTAFQLLDFVIFIIVIPAMFILYAMVAREIWVQRKKKEKHKHLEIAKLNVSTSGSGQTDNSTMETSYTETSEAKGKIDNEERELNQVGMQTITDKKSGKHWYGHMTNQYTPAFGNSKHQEKTRINVKRDGQQSQRSRADSVERKIAIMMIATTAGSVLSFLPYFIVNLSVKRSSNTPEQEFSVGMQIALRSFMMNNAINPYIMGIFNTKFKMFVKEAICGCRRSGI